MLGQSNIASGRTFGKAGVSENEADVENSVASPFAATGNNTTVIGGAKGQQQQACQVHHPPQSFQSPPRRGALRDSTRDGGHNKLQSSAASEFSSAGRYETRSSHKKKRLDEDAGPCQGRGLAVDNIEVIQVDDEILMNDKVKVTQGTYSGKEGLVKSGKSSFLLLRILVAAWKHHLHNDAHYLYFL